MLADGVAWVGVALLRLKLSAIVGMEGVGSERLVSPPDRGAGAAGSFVPAETWWEEAGGVATFLSETVAGSCFGSVAEPAKAGCCNALVTSTSAARTKSLGAEGDLMVNDKWLGWTAGQRRRLAACLIRPEVRWRQATRLPGF